MSEEKLHLASGVIDGKIYVCGGNYWKLYTSYSNVLEVYDPANRTWTKKANMPEGLSMHKAVSLDGYLYVVGGQKKLNDPDSSIELSQSVYKYDPISNSWSTVAPLPIPRVNHGLVTLNGKIYVIGGNNSTGVLDSIYEYDPLTDNWAAKEPMPQGYMQFSTAVINDKIYIIGGSDYSIDLSSVYEYDPVNETWTEKHSLPSWQEIVRYLTETKYILWVECWISLLILT
jgi:N-acetylneuraminic acid mutarotase